MANNAELALEILKGYLNQPEGTGKWLTIDQERISQFADATLDHQFIHTDPEKAAKLSPFKTTIAHGYLTLSLIPHLTESITAPYQEAFKNLKMMVNYGLDKLRFMNPVPVNAKIRAQRSLLEAELKDERTLQIKQLVTVEIEGQSKPACVAEVLVRLIY
ncbi:MaoC family dehydratase [Zooshikella ganghwensis]|uniref:MaoC family dehydratase n=1 Tax=Zooshikella ganghwensis TaxID=202772 RepID=A0A4P9VX86_9GAMM|nr:MaoC family dehydratase [Zooshikella ganghwensis]RDH46520.1 MaoC family dehydratase [Zooshikella ganghwensis]